MKAVIVAAGSGSRLKPYSLTGPKIMTKFLGKPLLFYHIDEFIQAGITGIIIVCNKESIAEIRKETKKAYSGIRFVEQDIQLGPAHAIHCAKDLLKNDEFFAYKYADSIHEKELLSSMIKCFKQSECDGAVTLRHTKEPKRYGIARIDGGKVIEIVEKPENPPSELAIIGLAILRSSLFFQGVEKDALYPGKKEVPPPDYILREGGKLNYWIYKGERADLGKPWDIILTNKLLLKRFGGRIESRKIGRNAKIGKDCYIGNKAVIEKGAVIKNYSSIEGKVGEKSIIDGSVVMDNSNVGKGCKIASSAIGKNNIVGDFVAIKTSSKNVFVKDHYEKPAIKKAGAFIGDNVAIASNTVIEGGKVIYPGKKISGEVRRDHLIRAILFDADNTLYNTRDVAKEADMAAMRHFSKQSASKLYQHWKENIVKKVMNEAEPYKRHRLYSYRLLAEELKLKDSEGAFRAFLMALLKKISLMPNARKTLSSLKGYKLGIISEDPSDLLLPKIKTLGIDRHFQLILSSGSVGKMKPCREYIDIALKALGVSAHECIFVGDSYEKDLAIPKEMGAVTVLYGGKGEADYSITDFEELKRIAEEN